ncbi:hypothetical protein [Coxiella endosymbiont of Ornithodoros maritimus]|uniref:hypothetical protein n=1 Tax=Coxiella endosymbiont of Ornithodoros maritimus TaxID=1656172 RepID=UPI0022648ADC|nr:hypothetical protein [Coxiella endosymbiont of Ornithodoros maritimus]
MTTDNEVQHYSALGSLINVISIVNGAVNLISCQNNIFVTTNYVIYRINTLTRSLPTIFQAGILYNLYKQNITVQMILILYCNMAIGV